MFNPLNNDLTNCNVGACDNALVSSFVANILFLIISSPSHFNVPSRFPISSRFAPFPLEAIQNSPLLLSGYPLPFNVIYAPLLSSEPPKIVKSNPEPSVLILLSPDSMISPFNTPPLLSYFLLVVCSNALNLLSCACASVLCCLTASVNCSCVTNAPILTVSDTFPVLLNIIPIVNS